jgi:glycosyltransferase involved in cell wall biosynthesis
MSYRVESASLSKVSVLLPVFNGERYLAECICSVLEQELEEFELLVSDDGSTDQSRRVIQSFSDPRIRSIYRQHNHGLFANLNFLIRAARYPLVRILGQDDILTSDCLAREVDFFTEHPSVGMTYCKYIEIDEEGVEIARTRLRDLPEIVEPRLSLQQFYYYGCMPGNISTVCIRRECFQEAGLFDESFRAAGDHEMWVRICRQRDLGIVHRYLVRLRSHRRQLSRSSGLGAHFISEGRRIRQMLLPLLPAEIQHAASRFSMLRHNVLDTHLVVRRLMAGRFRETADMVSVMGIRDLGLGLLFWLLTINNHLYRPQPRIVLEQTQLPDSK